MSDDVEVYHPETGTQVMVPEPSVSHLRRSGWLLLSEHQANQAQAAEREAAEREAAAAKEKR